MKLGAEGSAVQRPFVRYAQEAGWTYLPPTEALTLRGGESGLILREVFKQQAQALNPGVVDAAAAEDLIQRIERVAPRIEGNLEAWQYLRGVKTLYLPAERREKNVRLLEPSVPNANTFHVTDELWVQSGSKRVRYDVALFVNGIPVLVVEAKAATHAEGIAEALDQVRRYHVESPEMMAVMQLFALTHLIKFHYGPTWNAGGRGMMNWKDEQAGDYETLVKSFVAPARILRVLHDYILFISRDNELTKAVLRPHQMRAVERCLHRARDNKKLRGLIWHTQGSGKTYTMITLAKRLVEEPVFENPTVLMVVDRLDLEDQLKKNLDAAGVTYCRAQNGDHLKALLAADQRGVIVAMIHKFDEMPSDMSARQNIYVLVDEAHRTTGGHLGSYLMAALPNATYLGFTGTPIDKTFYGKGTFKTFGMDDEKGYLDKYSIAESIEDGATVPLHYTLAPSELRVDRQTLETEFLNMVMDEGAAVDMAQINRVLERAVTLRTMLKKPERVARVAQNIAQHFRDVIDPMGYKAFVVAVDREACALYKEELDRHLPAEWSVAVYSEAHNDPEHVQRHYLSEEDEERVRKAFRNPDALPKILIVTEKLLTGFDAPILYCMYLDKPMRDHVLLQAIARVNRPYEDASGRNKPAGFVMDFVGIFENLEKALAFDSQDVSGVIGDLALLEQQFAADMERARSEYLSLVEGVWNDKAVERVLSHFLDADVRQGFYSFVLSVQDLYEILAPSAFLRPFLDDYDGLIRMYQVVKSAYDPGVLTDRDLLRKTIRLVHSHTHAGAIEDPLEVIPLDEAALDQLADSAKPSVVKVFNLLKTITETVDQQAAAEPFLISIGQRAQQVIDAYQQRQLSTEDALNQLRELFAEILRARAASRSEGLDRLAFSLFWELQRNGVAGAKQVAVSAEEVLRQNPHWRVSNAQMRAVRTGLYKALVLAGVPVDATTEWVERMLRIAQASNDE